VARFCVTCGAPLATETSRFCTKCGAAVIAAAPHGSIPSGKSSLPTATAGILAMRYAKWTIGAVLLLIVVTALAMHRENGMDGKYVYCMSDETCTRLTFIKKDGKVYGEGTETLLGHYVGFRFSGPVQPDGNEANVEVVFDDNEPHDHWNLSWDFSKDGKNALALQYMTDGKIVSGDGIVFLHKEER
jgi:zinc-ribbon domain